MNRVEVVAPARHRRRPQIQDFVPVRFHCLPDRRKASAACWVSQESLPFPEWVESQHRRRRIDLESTERAMVEEIRRP